MHYVPSTAIRTTALPDSCPPSSRSLTEDAYEHLLSIPIFPGLTDSDQGLVVSALRGAL